jgi:arginine/lysine/ornithine decarboxylase
MPSEQIDVKKSEGRVLASSSVGCPPAVPILVCGEIVDKNAIKRFEYYKIDRISVVI